MSFNPNNTWPPLTRPVNPPTPPRQLTIGLAQAAQHGPVGPRSPAGPQDPATNSTELHPAFDKPED